MEPWEGGEREPRDCLKGDRCRWPHTAGDDLVGPRGRRAGCRGERVGPRTRKELPSERHGRATSGDRWGVMWGDVWGDVWAAVAVGVGASSLRSLSFLTEGHSQVVSRGR